MEAVTSCCQVTEITLRHAAVMQSLRLVELENLDLHLCHYLVLQRRLGHFSTLEMGFVISNVLLDDKSAIQKVKKLVN